jgi:hypothetical protein
MENLIYNHRHLATAGTIDFDDMVITSENIKHVAPHIRQNAAYMVFTDFESFKTNFSFSNDGCEKLSSGMVMNATISLMNGTAIVVYDRREKRLFCLE